MYFTSVVLKPSARMLASMIGALCVKAPSTSTRPASVTMSSADNPAVPTK